MRSTTICRAVLVAALVLAASRPAAAFDLTGHWEGKYTCTGVTNGAKTKTVQSPSVLVVTSIVGNRVAAYLDLQTGYLGSEIPDAAKPEKGDAVLIACGIDDDPTNSGYSEIVRLKVVTKGAKGVLGGTSVRSSGNGNVEVCKYKWKRVDTVDDNLQFACTT